MRDRSSPGHIRFLNTTLLTIAAACLLLPVTSAYGRQLEIGVLYWSMNIPCQVTMRKGLEDRAEQINIAAQNNGKPTVRLRTAVAGDGEAGIDNQIKQMQEMVSMKFDGIIVQPTDNAALTTPLRAANAAGIPVVAYDQYISGGTLAAYRTSDNYQAGYLDGEYIASKFPVDKEIRLILVEYPQVSSTVERVNGFLDAISENGHQYKILKTYTAIEPVSGRKAAKNILHDFPKPGSVDVVFTVNDGGGLAVVKGLVDAGRTEVMVATIDGDAASLANIMAKRLTVIDSAQFCAPLGAETMTAAYDLLTGDKPPYHALVPVFPITLETLEFYPGWHGPIPASFTKPWKSLHPEWQGQLRTIDHNP